jgi:hypothetical protein
MLTQQAFQIASANEDTCCGSWCLTMAEATVLIRLGKRLSIMDGLLGAQRGIE